MPCSKMSLLARAAPLAGRQISNFLTLELDDLPEAAVSFSEDLRLVAAAWYDAVVNMLRAAGTSTTVAKQFQDI